MEQERVIWSGRPSHWKDFGYHLVCLVFSAFVVPLGMSLWRFLSTRFTQYHVTSERLQLTTGVLSRRMEELELYRVKDTAFDQPFWLRLVGLANVVLHTSDASTPVLVIRAVRDARTLRENLRGAIEKLRERKRVREVDFS